MAKSEEYITLKEAAELSGYSPDYVGQLIRQGKLPGKQVFSNIAWMTTESAILEYVAQKGKTSNSKYGAFERMKEAYANPESVIAFARFVFWIAIVTFGAITLALLFLFAVGIDRSIEERSLQTIEYAS